MIKIDIGCGKNCLSNYICVDISPKSDANIIHDCENGLPFENDYADEIRAYDFLEHIHRDKIIFVFNEIWRVLKPNGILDFKVPDAMNGQGAFQDLTHHTTFTLNTFKYFETSLYRDLYGIKPFRVEELKSIEYDNEYWGKNWCLMGRMRPVKNIQSKIVRKLPEGFVYTTDDVCPSNLKYWHYWDKIHDDNPGLKVIAFTIANYQSKENISESKEFKEWYEKRKDWVEIQPHGVDHTKPQEGWRPYNQQKEDLKKSIEILKPYLPQNIIYRFPGFRTLGFSESILKELGCAGIANQRFIKYFNTGEILPTFDTHCTSKCSDYKNSVEEIWENLNA